VAPRLARARDRAAGLIGTAVAWSFGSHFSALAPGCDDTAGAASLRLDEVRADLRRALELELRRRGLWGSPPSYLGVLGHPRWDREALDELAGECYLHQLARLRSLQAQLRAGADIDGFVLLNVRHFVFERQRAHDPLGYRVFEMLERAVERGRSEGRLRLEGESQRVRNDTIVVLGSAAGGASQAAPDPDDGGARLAAAARRWNDDLLPALVTAQGAPQRDAVVARLLAHLEALRAAGVRAFRLGDLIDPLKRDVRARWAALAEPAGEEVGYEGEGETLQLVRTVAPETAYEEREHLTRLLACAAERCAHLPPEAGAGELLSLLGALARHATDERADEAPSARAVARETAIPRHRLPLAYARLRDLLADCRRAIDAPRPVSEPLEPPARGGPPTR
jgi:hypothetical protein